MIDKVNNVLYAQFFLDEDRYVIAARDIVEIVPVISLKTVSMLPDYAAGLMNYHGNQVPVIDLCYLFLGRACRKRLSTRILLASKVDCSKESSMMLGFMVEKATEMLTIDADLYKPPAMRNPEAPTNGPIVEYRGSLVTEILIEDMLDKLDKKIFHQSDILAREKTP